MRTVTDTLVIGSGVGAIVAAHTLAGRGVKVVVADGAPSLGGGSRSLRWEGYTLDLGCQLIGNGDDLVTAAFLDLMDGDAVGIDPRVASVLDGQLTAGTEFPDLRGWAARTEGRALTQLLAAALGRAPGAGVAAAGEVAVGDTVGEVTDADAALTLRFGRSVASRLGTALRRATRTELAALDPVALHALPAGRVLVVDDTLADALKAADPRLDATLLRPRPDDPHHHLRDRVTLWPSRCLYPSSGGIGGFPTRATSRLQRMGVDLRLGDAVTHVEVTDGEGTDREVTAVTADGHELRAHRLVLAVDEARAAQLLDLAAGHSDLEVAADPVVGVPAVMAWFDVPANAVDDRFHWVTLYDADHEAYRVSFPASYGPGVAPPGRAVVACELLTHRASPTFRDPEPAAARAWHQLVELGLVRGQPADALVKAFPTTYRFPRAGHAARTASFRRWVDDHPNVVAQEGWRFTKDQVAASVLRPCLTLLEEDDR